MAHHEVSFVGGRVTGAIVPKSSVGKESWYLPYEVIRFINYMRTAAQYASHELSPEILQIYSADYYLAQVNNGGHSQFVGNSGQNLSANIEAALPGLQLIGATAQHGTLADLKSWIAANPQEAAAQNGFSARAKALDALDARFYEAEKTASITDLAARWISTWPDLEISDDENYAARMTALLMLNPNFEIRRIHQAIERNRFNLTDTLQLTVAVACGAVEPGPDVKININAGSRIDFDGEEAVEWGVTTDKGLRYVVTHSKGGTIFETVTAANGRSRTAGRKLANATAQKIKEFADAVVRYDAAAAIDLVMLRAGLSTKDVGYPAITAWKLGEAAATFIAHIKPRNLIIRTSADGAALLDDGGKVSLSVSKEEIAAHKAEARRGYETLTTPS